MSPAINQPAPDFALKDQNGTQHRLSGYRGKWVLVYFYPADNTPGCTTEACEIRDAFPDFQNVNAVVLGISPDSEQSHKKFADEFRLPFTLLADEQKMVVNQYGVWREKKMMGKTFMGVVRTSFLINPEGVIAKIYENVKPETHAKEVLADITSMVH